MDALTQARFDQERVRAARNAGAVCVGACGEPIGQRPAFVSFAGGRVDFCCVPCSRADRSLPRRMAGVPVPADRGSTGKARCAPSDGHVVGTEASRG